MLSSQQNVVYRDRKVGETKMGIRNWAEDIILVDLPPESQMKDEIESVTEIVYNSNSGTCDVVMDFSSVDIVTSANLVGLSILSRLLTDRGHRLVLCNVHAPTRDIFAATGLEEIFEFADDKSAASAELQRVN